MVGEDGGDARAAERRDDALPERLHVLGRRRAKAMKGERSVEGVVDDQPSVPLADQAEHVGRAAS